jgi:hypothetical protein
MKIFLKKTNNLIKTISNKNLIIKINNLHLWNLQSSNFFNSQKFYFNTNNNNNPDDKISGIDAIKKPIEYVKFFTFFFFLL